MSHLAVTQDNLDQVIKRCLLDCEERLAQAETAGINLPLIRDLRVATHALQLIEAELRGNVKRPKGQRSAMFTRYIIDEESQIVMDADLADTIMRIEGVYKRL